MPSLLFWVYFTNCTLLLCHEIDAAYWKEWDLFGIGGEEGGFVLSHLLIIPPPLYGLIEAFQGTFLGNALSLVVGLAGIGCFAIHMYYLSRGKNEFRTRTSLFILGAIMAASVVQTFLSIQALL